MEMEAINLRKTFTDGMDHILSGSPISPSDLMEYSNACFTYCRVKEAVIPQFETNGEPKLGVGQVEFKVKLQEKLDTHLAGVDKELKLVGAVGEELLRQYGECWVKYKKVVELCEKSFGYINRYYAQLDLVEENSSMIWNLAMNSWERLIFSPIADKLPKEVFELIQKERQGQDHSNAPVKEIISSFILFSNSKTKNFRNAYKNLIESPYLLKAKEFYENCVAEVLNSSSQIPTSYINYVKSQLSGEIERAKKYLHKNSISKIQKCLEKVLILDKQEYISKEIDKILDERIPENLTSLCYVASLDATISKLLCEKWLEAILAYGNRKLDEILNTANVNNNNESLDAKTYVDSILEIYDLWNGTLEKCFNTESKLKAQLKKGLEIIINGKPELKPAERFAKYADKLLKKVNTSGKNAPSCEILNKLCEMIGLLKDNKNFLRKYKRDFTFRMIYQNSRDPEGEKCMLKYFEDPKAHICPEFSSKLALLYKDITIASKSNKKEFSKKFPDNKFQMWIVASWAWPSKLLASQMSFVLPVQLQTHIVNFSENFISRYPDKRLNWLYEYSTGELTTLGNISLHVSVYQMSILMLFNDQDEMTVGEISEMTGLDMKATVNCIERVLKHEILTCEYDPEKLDEGSKICYNENFKSNKPTMKLF